MAKMDYRELLRHNSTRLFEMNKNKDEEEEGTGTMVVSSGMNSVSSL